MPLRFTFKESPLRIKNAKKANAQAIGTELMRITAEHGGRLKPEHAWEAARNQRNPLHRHIEWDTALAAKAYQLDQCRELIRIVRVVDTERDDQERRAFLSVNDNGVAFRTVGEVLDNRNLQLATLKQAERDLRAWEERYNDLIEICEMVRQARLKIVEQIDLEARPQ